MVAEEIAVMEHYVMTQRATVLLLSLLCFMSQPDKRLGGPGTTKVHGCHRCPDIR